jgi:hypothetical protein
VIIVTRIFVAIAAAFVLTGVGFPKTAAAATVAPTQGLTAVDTSGTAGIAEASIIPNAAGYSFIILAPVGNQEF